MFELQIPLQLGKGRIDDTVTLFEKKNMWPVILEGKTVIGCDLYSAIFLSFYFD